MLISDGLLWDIAIDLDEKKEDEADESSIILTGSKTCGKTSMILRFLERDEPSKPTLSLEYTFGRRSKGHNSAKDVGHIWELGGGTWLSQLISVPLNKESLTSCCLSIIVDLSSPSTIFNVIDTMISSTLANINNICSADSKLKSELASINKQRFENHQDKAMLSVLPIPLVIIGAKYDIFQDFEPEKRKIICKTLRFVSHLYGAHLLFFSSKNENTITKCRLLFSHILFKTSLSKANITEYNSPLNITAGSDSFQAIGSPPIKEANLGRSSAKTPLDLWRSSFTSQFPPESKADTLSTEDPGKDEQFKEPEIDQLRILKNIELERYRKQVERKIKERKIAKKKFK